MGSIVCAAMLMDDGYVIPCVRHYDTLTRPLLKRLYGENYHKRVQEQGFLDSHGYFHGRTRAYEIALEVGQIRNGHNPQPGTLFSECLY